MQLIRCVACGGRSDRYLLAFEKAKPLLGGLVPARDLGFLKMSLRDDATSHDILTAVLHSACFRRLLRCREDSATWSSSVSRSEGEERQSWWKRYDGTEVEALERADVDSLLEMSHTTAQRQARKLLRDLKKQQWQMQPFMLSSSERGGYSVLE